MARLPSADAAARKRLRRDLLLAGVVFAVVLGSILVYSRTWPPALVVDSNSMQHGDAASSFGVADTGDIVFLQAVGGRGDVVTYLEGRASGYATYGDFGDVIAFEFPLNPGNFGIHRALAFAVWNATASGYDIPELDRLPRSEWSAWDAANASTDRPYGLSRFEVRDAGWRSGATLRVNLTLGERTLLAGAGETGFLTMGDNNVYSTLTKVDRWIVPLDTVVGKARGEIPWLGLIRLVIAPDPEGCCNGWGSTDSERGAPGNSWAALDAILILLAAIPIAWFASAAYLNRHPDSRARLRETFSRLRFWQRDMGVKPAKEIGPPEENAAPIRPSEIPASRAPAGRFPRTSPAQVVQEWLNSRDATPPRRPGEAEREKPSE